MGVSSHIDYKSFSLMDTKFYFRQKAYTNSGNTEATGITNDTVRLTGNLFSLPIIVFQRC